MAEFQESAGNFVDALEWYSKIEERYSNSLPLAVFCARHSTRTGNSQLDQEIQKHLQAWFPQGIEKVTLENFGAPPSDGVFIQEENELLRNAGLQKGDIIVAVDGIRVHNFKQYVIGRDVNIAPEMALIVWHDGRYSNIKASPPSHQFGVKFTSYPPK